MLTEQATADLVALKAAQGTDRWHATFKAADATLGNELRTEFRRIKTAAGQVTVMDIAKIAVRSGVPWRTLFRYLEGEANRGADSVLPSGVCEALAARHSGTVGEILELARRAIEAETDHA